MLSAINVFVRVYVHITWNVSHIPDQKGDLNDNDPFCCFFLIGANEDYLSGPYFVLVPAGMTEAVFNISLNDNGILEETETFSVVIDSSSLPNNVTIGELGEAVVTILDNDGEFLSNRMLLGASLGWGGIYIHLQLSRIHM